MLPIFIIQPSLLNGRSHHAFLGLFPKDGSFTTTTGMCIWSQERRQALNSTFLMHQTQAIRSSTLSGASHVRVMGSMALSKAWWSKIKQLAGSQSDLRTSQLTRIPKNYVCLM